MVDAQRVHTGSLKDRVVANLRVQSLERSRNAATNRGGGQAGVNKLGERVAPAGRRGQESSGDEISERCRILPGQGDAGSAAGKDGIFLS